MPASREDQYTVTLTVEGIGDTGSWEQMTGGNTDSEEVKHRPAGGLPQKSLGGPRSIENVTVSRVHQRGTDDALMAQLQAASGRAEATVVKQPLDRNFVAFGPRLVYTGVLKAVTPPDFNVDGDAARLEVEISTDGI